MYVRRLQEQEELEVKTRKKTYEERHKQKENVKLQQRGNNCNHSNTVECFVFFLVI